MSGTTTEIKHLDKLLTNKMASSLFIKKYETKSLVEPGENYGSILLSITVELQDSVGGKTTELHLVGKTCPKFEWVKTLFQTAITFKREIAMYDTILPTLVKYQQEHGIVKVFSSFPKYYGARISLNTDLSEVDDDAIILMENVTFLGFNIGDRMEGFDLDTTKLILKDLAIFHAITVAIKINKPEIFNCKILPHLSKLKHKVSEINKVDELMIKNIVEVAKLNNECLTIIPQLLKGIEYSSQCERATIVPQEPFATINHNDFWVNNIMLKFDGSHPIETKFVDYQFIGYGSPALDIVFLLYTSVQSHVVNDNFNDLIYFYFTGFINTLKSLKCETEPFGYELFLQEIEIAAKHQFWHILRMQYPIFTPKGKYLDLSKAVENNGEDFQLRSEKYCKRISTIIMDFAKKKWI